MSLAFRVDVDDPLTGAENMRRDAALVEEVRGAALGVARLYTWRPYAVSLGHSQREESIDRAACDALGIDIVRRPTGGRAVLHAEELTYAIVTPLDGHSAQEWYAAIHRAIGAAVATLGLNDAAFVRSQPKFADVYRQRGGAMCFTSSARYELEWNSRKFVGSAQRVIGDVLLQHGSILLGRYHERLADVVAGDAAQRDALRRMLCDRAISISEILGRAVDAAELIAPLRTEFLSTLTAFSESTPAPVLSSPTQ